MRRIALSVASMILIVSLATAAEPTSGPKVGEKAAGFEVLVATGDQMGKTLDYLTAIKDKPVLLVFIREKDKTRAAFAFLKTVDQYAQLRQPEGLETLLVRVADDKDAAVKYAQLLKERYDFKSTGAVATAGAGGPPDYGISDEAEMTVLLLDKEHKVLANTARRAPERQDFKEVRAAIDKLLGPSPVPFE